MGSKHFTPPYLQSPPPAVFHDKYQWEIWKKTAGKSATPPPPHLTVRFSWSYSVSLTVKYPGFNNIPKLPQLKIISNSIHFGKLIKVEHFLAGQIGFRPFICSIKAVPAVIPHREECGFDARIHRACRGCGVRNHVVGTVGLRDINLIFFMFVTALDVINKFSYMGFVINLIMSGISLKDNQWELSSFSRPPHLA